MLKVIYNYCISSYMYFFSSVQLQFIFVVTVLYPHFRDHCRPVCVYQLLY